VKICIC